jgi:dTDP-4-dehydrorhamnose reductase
MKVNAGAPRVLVLGAAGMLGHKLYERLPAQLDVIGTARTPTPRLGAIRRHSGRIIDGVDVSDFGRIDEVMSAVRPDVVVNCVGVIKQRDDGSDPVACISYNALLPHQLAARCKASGTRLIQISTDCVFSGNRGQYRESDTPDPVDVYGLSKLLGEVDGSDVLTVRTSMVGRELATYRSLLEWFLRQRGTVRGFTRAIFSGLTTSVVADELGRVILSRPDVHGIYNLCGAAISKFELLTRIRAAFGLDVEVIPDDSFQCDRSLVGDSYAADAGFVAPSWEEMIAGLASERRWYDEHPGAPT